MAAQNDITGDALRSKPATDKYRDNWERIFGNKNKSDKKNKMVVAPIVKNPK